MCGGCTREREDGESEKRELTSGEHDYEGSWGTGVVLVVVADDCLALSKFGNEKKE
jgi:hypothetical protein